MGVCNVAGKPLSSTNLSFSLIPRLNAAGRMGNADLALDLLMTDDFEEAQQKATELDCVDTVYRNPHGLDDGEVAFIESMIKPMDLGEPDEG